MKNDSIDTVASHQSADVHTKHVNGNNDHRVLSEGNGTEYDFFQLLRRIENLDLNLPRIGFAHHAHEESLRIAQSAALDFAPTEVEHLGNDAQNRAQVRQRFFGLFGPNGPMPLHFTQWVRDRSRHDYDSTLEAFVNLFHHRMATLFYRSWASSRGTVQRDRPTEDRFGDKLASLTGSADSRVNFTQRDQRRFFCGHFGGAHRNAEGLQQVVASTTGSKVAVKSFALRYLRLEEENHTRLARNVSTSTNDSSYRIPAGRGETRAQLGVNSVLGRSTPDRCSGLDVGVGPLERSDFLRLIPTGEEHSVLKNVIREYVGIGFDCRVVLSLQTKEIEPICLGKTGQLGIQSWVGTPRTEISNSDCHFRV